MLDFSPSASPCILVHYSEIALKGRNRGFFEKKLQSNIEKAVEGKACIRRLNGRYLLFPTEENHLPFLREKVGKILGVQNYCQAYECRQEISCIKEKALELVNQKLKQNGATQEIWQIQQSQRSISRTASLKIEAKRTDKTFEMTSSDVDRKVGDYLRQRLPIRFSMKHPDIKVTVEIVKGAAYLYTEKVGGFGGLPVGSEGKVLCLLSGGIDSPVAAWLMMKRGCYTDFVHFHPFSDDFHDHENDVLSTPFIREKFSKILELVGVLSEYCFKARLHLMPFLPFQMKMLEVERGNGTDYERYELMIFKRFMLKVASEIGAREKIPALATGDNLGQVASQTLANLAITDRPGLPVFRPLLCYDKQEITNLAQRIGTYEISLLPYKDCCSIVSKHPATSAKKEKIEKIEKEANIDGIIQETVENAVTISVNSFKKSREGGQQSPNVSTSKEEHSISISDTVL